MFVEVNRNACRPGRMAFTLVEVVLALGLASTALLALVSLLGSGLTLVSESGDMATRTAILRSLGARVRQSGWELDAGMVPMVPRSLGGGRLIFDDQGTELEGDGAGRGRYWATVEWGEEGVVLPGALVPAEVGAAGNPFNRMVKIQVGSEVGGGEIQTSRVVVACLRPVRMAEP